MSDLQSKPQTAGSVLFAIAAGVVTVALLLRIYAWSVGHISAGTIAALVLVLAIFGLVLRWPMMLRDDSGTVSAMRVAMIAVVTVFCALVLKAGWTASSISELKLDTAWAGLVAAVIAGKTIQSFAEPTLPAMGTRPTGKAGVVGGQTKSPLVSGVRTLLAKSRAAGVVAGTTAP